MYDESLLTHAEVLDSLPRVLWAAEENRVAALRGAESELVESQALAAGGLDSLAGRAGEAESSDAELGQVQKTVVIGDGANDDACLGSLRASGDTTTVLGQVHEARNRDRRTVDLGHEQSAEHSLVEARVRAAGKEAIELHKEEEVRVLALGRRTAPVLDVVLGDVDTLCKFKRDKGQPRSPSSFVNHLRLSSSR